MSSGRKCKNCGGSDIEVDPARGDAVCTTCGSVLEDSIIVAEIQFEEGAHGSSSAIGQFVSSDSKGGATKFGASFHVGDSGESRELTLKKARKGISNLCNQLQLNQHCIDTACSFFKMALSRNLTRGRKFTHVHAACVYMTCRTEGTAHLLIDISDVLQICCYELGRTYMKISHALCINIPAVDPCIYILRFASKLQFGAKTQQVANTALRLVQRMKRDSIHSGRRPSGLCGAALLIAARLHDFGRSPKDIVKIVKVHEDTLRRRLMEFGDTPSSALTLDEFMNIDLEEEQDPPSFKAARKKDKERLQKFEEEADNFSDLQKQIEKELEHNSKKRKSVKVVTPKNEVEDTERFIEQSTMETVTKLLGEEAVDDPERLPERGLGPDIASMGLAASLEDTSNAPMSAPEEQLLDLNLDFDDIDDDEIDSYIMSDKEFETKKVIWHRINADYLEEQKVKAERLQKEREEGKPEKKRKRTSKKRTIGPASSAGEAIEKILQEKKISTKINYDVLKSLSSAPAPNEPHNVDEEDAASTSESIKRRRLSSVSNHLEMAGTSDRRKTKGRAPMGMPIFDNPKEEPKEMVKKEEKAEEEGVSEKETTTIVSDEELDEDYEDDDQPVDANNEMGVLQMLRQHREDEDDNHEFGYDYYDEGDY